MICNHQWTDLIPDDEGYHRTCMICGEPVVVAPSLPPADSPGRCPMPLPDGRVCNQALVYAHTVREYRPVTLYAGSVLCVGDRTDMDAVPDRDSLYCTAGHEWAVPERVVPA